MRTGYVYEGGKRVTHLIGGPHDGLTMDMHMNAGDECRMPKLRPAFKPEEAGVPMTLLDDADLYVALTQGLAVYAPDRHNWHICLVRLAVDLSVPGAADPGNVAPMLDPLPPGVIPAPAVGWRDDDLGICRMYTREGIARRTG